MRRVSRAGSNGAPKLAEQFELARYTLTEGERVLYGQQVDGLLRVTDCPACEPGRSYLVEGALKSDACSALYALLTDYTRRAERLDEIPMAASLDVRVEQTELLRYTLSGGERILYGQRVDGVVRVTDRPADGSGRSYLVECGLEQDGHSAFKALLADYIRQAQELDEIPMATTSLARFRFAPPSAPPAEAAASGLDERARRPQRPQRTLRPTARPATPSSRYFDSRRDLVSR